MSRDPVEKLLDDVMRHGKCRGFPEKTGCPYPPVRKGLCLIHFGRYCKSLSKKLRKA